MIISININTILREEKLLIPDAKKTLLRLYNEGHKLIIVVESEKSLEQVNLLLAHEIIIDKVEEKHIADADIIIDARMPGGFTGWNLTYEILKNSNQVL